MGPEEEDETPAAKQQRKPRSQLKLEPAKPQALEEGHADRQAPDD